MTHPEEQLALARRLAADDRIDEAAQAYRAVCDLAPLEATAFLGGHAVRRRRWAEAVPLLGQAAQIAPNDPGVLENLGLACERTGAFARARDALERVLELDPGRFVARLVLGFVEYRQGRAPAAVANIQLALRQAHQQGLWLDSSTTQAWLQDHVFGAVGFIRRYQYDRLNDALKGADGDTRRVEAFIRGQLGIEVARSSDPRQAPKKHYMPGLPPTPWFDPTLFPWARRLQESFPVILSEYLSVAGADQGFESFLTFKSAEQVAKYLGTTGPAPEWNAFFFYRHGVRNDENCARCPRTAALLDELPLIKLPGATPEVCFSVLTPGSHILPHRGDANLRSVVHLGLVVPDQCALNVAGEARTWEPGGLLAFDDTYEHEAWNRSDQARAVLLMDAWNPYLSEAERRVLPGVIGALGELARQAEQPRDA